MCGGMLGACICCPVSLCEGLCARGTFVWYVWWAPRVSGGRQWVGASVFLGVLTCVPAAFPVWVPVLGCSPLYLGSVGSCVQ